MLTAMLTLLIQAVVSRGRPQKVDISYVSANSYCPLYHHFTQIALRYL